MAFYRPLIIEFPDSTKEKLDRMCQKLGTNNLPLIVHKALALLEIATELVDEDNKIILLKNEKTNEVIEVEL